MFTPQFFSNVGTTTGQSVSSVLARCTSKRLHVTKTIIQKEDKVLSYQITDPGKLNAKYWKNAATELTVASALGAGLPFLGTLMSAEGRGNFKALFNSPNTLNPTQVKIVQATPSARGKELYGSLADTTGGSITNHAGGEVITPSGKSFSVPAQASRTVKQANEWQRTVGGELETLVNSKAALREQAAQAVRIANDIVLAARNAMEDANAAAQLMMTNPIRSFNELLQTFGKEFSGDALYKKVIGETKEMLGKVVTPRTVSAAGYCFAAGTMVHTKDGLKPIEQIQVGDWVLSKPESGEGEQAYKRVAKTFSFEDKVVRFVEYSVLRNGAWHHDTLTVTPNHPFWVTGIDESLFPSFMTWDDLTTGWTRADELFGGLLIELSTGEIARVTSNNNDLLWKTNRPGIAWEATVKQASGVYRDASTGERRPISTDERISINHDFHDDDTFSARDENTEWEKKWLYTTKVYNFEVEDFHTYYVGNLGAWVHNTNCHAATVEYLKKNGVFSGQNPGFSHVIEFADARDLRAGNRLPHMSCKISEMG